MININENPESKLIDILSSFHTIEDMIVFLAGYTWELLNIKYRNSKENAMDFVFPESIFSTRLIKEVSERGTLDEMESYLREYSRHILEKAIERKNKKVLEEWFSYSTSKRYEMLEAAGVEVDRNPKGRRGMNTYENPYSLATNFGLITYKKQGIIIPTLNNSKRNYCPLDDCLNLLPGIHYPKSILKQIGKLIPKMSYRQTAQTLKDMGIHITQATVWNLVRDVIAPRIYDLEKERTLSYLLGKEEDIGTEREKISTLFLEWDGVWLSLDNTKDESQKLGKKRELKLGKSYIGWAKRYGVGEEASYKTMGTRYIAGFETPDVLREMLNGKIHEAFDYANVKQIIVNGDGANWIFQDYDVDARVVLQLDMFHIRQRMNRCVPEGKKKKQILKLLKEDKYLEITELLSKDIESRERTENVKKEKELLEYLNNNFGALRRYQKVIFVKLESGMEARNLGTMESSVRQVIGRRMKMSAWSLEGAKAMATILCLEHEEKLDEVLEIVLDRNYKLKHDDIHLPSFIQNYKNGIEAELVEKGRKANKKIIAKGKYLAAVRNVDINFKKLIEANQMSGKFLPKDII